MARMVGVKIEGLAELEKKLGYPFLVDPAVNEGLGTIGTRVERGGKGLGARRNLIQRVPLSEGLKMTSTRIYPRTRGTSWLNKNVRVIRAMFPNVLRKAAQRIEQRWAS